MSEIFCKRTSCRHNSQEHCNCSVIELERTMAATVWPPAMGSMICKQYERRPMDAGRIDDLVSGRAKWGDSAL